MNNPRQPKDVVADNESSLKALVRAIRLSQGQFRLILARCNYAALRERMVQRLRELSPVQIRDLVLPHSVKTLYTTIKAELGDEVLHALMVFGLESVSDIRTVLTSSNYIREEFSKNFPFPLVLWINDQVQQKLLRLAPDLESWATSVEFALTTNELLDFLRLKTDELFASDLTPNLQDCFEIEAAWNDLQSLRQVLDPDLEASLEFLWGLEYLSKDQIDTALEHYQKSLAFWQQINYLERQGIVLSNIALSYYHKAEQNRAESQRCLEESRYYFQQCLDVFDQQHRPDLVAKHISKFGEVLRCLSAWEPLDNLIQKALVLHQNYGNPRQLAQDYGFLAEVALERSRWDEATSFAQQALQILYTTPNFQPNEESLYRYLLARSLRKLGQVQEAIIFLKQADEVSNAQYKPQLYINILEELRSLYFDQGQYLDAFLTKQKQRLMEQQYGFRAFIGASHLHPQIYSINPALVPVDRQATVAQEIIASGRQRDVNRLIERITSTYHKLTIIHGQSGVGKTSLVKAGLEPMLKQRAIGERDALAIVVRFYTDWVRELGRALAQELEVTRGVKLSTSLDSVEAISEQLQKNEDRNLITVLIFDQFEEFFFVYTSKVERRLFFDFLQGCLNTRFVKVILSLREDYIHYLLECERLVNLDAINNNILDRNIRYYLGNFSREDAISVIQSLTRRSQIYLEPVLIDELVEDLADELGQIRPIELQVVGVQLQTDNITTLERYHQLGPKTKLVERFLEEVIKDCGAENERAARLVLFLLTDENGIRPLKTRTELAIDLATEAEELDLVLEIFVMSGLVVLLPEAPADRYQLVHDYLVSFIRQQQVAEQERQRVLNEEQERLLLREKAAREVAETANRTKDEFLAVLSHELRAPLNPILGWVKLLRSRIFDKKTTDRALETLERNAILLARLIDDLLDISRIVKGQFCLDIAPCELIPVIEAGIDAVHLAATAKNIQIECFLDRSLGPVLGDPLRLQQVVWNLLSNAVKFTPLGGRVEVRLEHISTTQQYAQIRVTDTGIGIDSNFLPRVFEAFQQEDSLTSRSFGGLGLGLSIVRYIVELHGGTVSASSAGRRQGATFTVTLPLIPIPTDANEP